MAVSRIWQLTFPEAPAKSAKYKISFAVDVRDIPADGLNHSTKLISRLTEMGGDVKAFHIQVDPVFSRESIPDDAKIEVLKPKPRSASTVWQPVRRQAS
jgi:hypothetical protein